MSDEQPTGQPAPASAPEAPAIPSTGFDPAAFKAELEASWSRQLAERISGIQSGYQQQLNERDEQIRQLKNATLSEEERAQQAEAEAAEYLESLELKAALADLQVKHPKAAPHIQKLFETGSLEEQAAYLESLLSPQPPAVEPSEAVPPVDANNPPRTPSVGDLLTVDGKVMTEDMRKQILQSFEGMSFAEAQRRG